MEETYRSKLLEVPLLCVFASKVLDEQAAFQYRQNEELFHEHIHYSTKELYSLILELAV